MYMMALQDDSSATHRVVPWVWRDQVFTTKMLLHQHNLSKPFFKIGFCTAVAFQGLLISFQTQNVILDWDTTSLYVIARLLCAIQGKGLG